MYLVEQIPIGRESLPLADLRGHLRLGTGFADDAVQDDLLERALRGAIAEVERLTGKALIHREFVLHLQDWSGSDQQILPRAPVSGVSEVAILRQDGSREILDRNRYRLQRDAVRPVLRSTGFMFPAIPVGANAGITFLAGFGEDWSAVPPDLALAVVTLAAARYEDRQGSRGIPEGVRALISPYRQIRLMRSV